LAALSQYRLADRAITCIDYGGRPHRVDHNVRPSHPKNMYHTPALMSGQISSRQKARGGFYQANHATLSTTRERQRSSLMATVNKLMYARIRCQMLV